MNKTQELTPSQVNGPERQARVLLVDDEELELDAFHELLCHNGLDVLTTSSPEDALRIICEESVSVIISDQRMPRMNGTELLEKVRDLSPDTVRIILTGDSDLQVAIDAINRGAVYRFLMKPWDSEQYCQVVHDGVRLYELVQENRRLHQTTEDQNDELRELNHQLASAHDREIEIAHRIQQTLLLAPPPEQIAGLAVAALTIPSKSVDGDFYDFFKIGDSTLDLVVGDVMGKGIPAALMGAAAKSMIPRALSRLLLDAPRDGIPQPEAIITSVHEEIARQLMSLESFITVCYARFETRRRRATFVDCGHTRTIHLQPRTGGWQFIQGTNMPWGLSEWEDYGSVAISFDPGDIFLFYTDGITEAESPSEELFGERRLARLAWDCRDQGPRELVESVHQALREFTHANGAFEDDLTCVALKILG